MERSTIYSVQKSYTASQGNIRAVRTRQECSVFKILYHPLLWFARTRKKMFFMRFLVNSNIIDWKYSCLDHVFSVFVGSRPRARGQRLTTMLLCWLYVPMCDRRHMRR